MWPVCFEDHEGQLDFAHFIFYHFFLLNPKCVTGMVPTRLKSGVLSLAFPPVEATGTDFTAPLAFHVRKVRTGARVSPSPLPERDEGDPPREARLVGVITPGKAIF